MDLELVSFLVLVGTFLVGIYQIVGVWHQWRTIVRSESGDAVVLYPHVTNLAYFSSSVIYAAFNDLKLLGGIALGSGIVTALVLKALAEYQKWGTKEYVAVSFVPMWLVVILAVERGGGESFAPISVIAVLTTITQPFKMWRAKAAGSIDVRLYYSFGAGGAFWSFYAWLNHEPVNSVACPIFFASHMMTIFLYRRYKRE